MATKPALLFSGEMAQSGESGVDRCLFFVCLFFIYRVVGVGHIGSRVLFIVAFLNYLFTAAAAVVSLQTG